MIEKVKKLIEQTEDRKLLSKWYCQLNSFKTAVEFELDECIPDDKVGDYMKLIDKKISYCEFLYYWNVHHSKTMTQDEFLGWWHSSFKGRLEEIKHLESWEEFKSNSANK